MALLESVTTQPSSLSYIAVQHQLHKERMERIKRAAIKELTKPLPAQPPPPPPVIIISPEPEKYFSISDLVMRTVCDQYRVRRDDIMSQRRLGNVVKARHAIIVMLYRFTKWTTFKIAERVNRDPSVVFYVLQKQERAPIDFSELERIIQDKLCLIKGST